MYYYSKYLSNIIYSINIIYLWNNKLNNTTKANNCQILVIGFAIVKILTNTLFHKYLPNTNISKYTITNVINVTNNSPLEKFCKLFPPPIEFV